MPDIKATLKVEDQGLNQKLKDTSKNLKDLGTDAKDFGSKAGGLSNILGKVASSSSTASIALGSFIGSFAGGLAAAAVTELSSILGTLTEKIMGSADATRQWAATINDIEDKTNMSGESASRLVGVAKTVGLAGGEMGSALAIMSRNAQTAVEQINKASEAGELSEDNFTKWGISIADTNGNLLAAEEIYKNINTVHRDMANGVEKTAMEMEIFGRSGAKLNDLLNLSEDQVAATTKKLEEMGLVMDHDTTQAWEDADIQGRILQQCIDGLFVQIGSQFLPIIQRTTDDMMDLVQWLNNTGGALDLAKGAAELCNDVMDGLSATVWGLKVAYENLVQPVLDACAALGQFISLKSTVGGMLAGKLGFDTDNLSISSLAQPAAITLMKGLIGAKRDADLEALKDWHSSGNSDDWDFTPSVKKYIPKSLTQAGTIGGSGGGSAGSAGVIKTNSITDIAKALADAGTEFGVNGCTAFVSSALKSTQWSSLFEGEGKDVGYALEVAKKAGLFHSGMEGVSEGDTIIYDNGQYNRPGSHVGIYDGAGGVYHNATSAGYTAYHQEGSISMGEGTTAIGYIPTGASGLGKDVRANIWQDVDKKAKDLLKAQETLKTLSADLSGKILENTGTPLEIAMASLEKNVTEMQSKIRKAAMSGVDEESLAAVQTKLTQYIAEEKLKVEREAEQTSYDLQVKHLDAVGVLEEKAAGDVNNLKLQTLEKHKAYLQEQLNSSKLNALARVQVEQELADTISAIQTQNNSTIQGGWESTLRYMRDYSVDYFGIMKSGVDSIASSFDGLMDGVISGQKSLMDNVHSAWTDIGNTILNTLWKIMMQAYVMQPLMKAIGIGGTGGGASDLSGFGQNYLSNMALPTFASGGYASGWAVVGEKGPELARFDNPAQIYTAGQTARALGGAGGAIDKVNISITNNTGTESKVSSATVDFDALKGLIINTVIEKVTTNDGGARDVFRGALAAY